MKPKPTKHATCQFCNKDHEFAEPVKSFVCTGCGVGQKVILNMSARQSVGRNETGHYVPPCVGGHK